MKNIGMNVREYMTMHTGQYTCPESHVPLTVDMLSDPLLREEVTQYHVGQNAGGGSKYHLYIRNTVHIATHIDTARDVAINPRTDMNL
jgi:hypothetical protein